jgi:hypothetical protein
MTAPAHPSAALAGDRAVVNTRVFAVPHVELFAAFSVRLGWRRGGDRRGSRTRSQNSTFGRAVIGI